jgi:VanZ family protein
MNRRAGLAIGWAAVAVVIYLSLTPSPPDSGIDGGDKLGHFLAYAGLTYWFGQFYSYRTRAAYALGFFAMGIALELAQGALGYRSLELADVAANTLGVATGWGAAALLPLRRRQA